MLADVDQSATTNTVYAYSETVLLHNWPGDSADEFINLKMSQFIKGNIS